MDNTDYERISEYVPAWLEQERDIEKFLNRRFTDDTLAPKAKQIVASRLSQDPESRPEPDFSKLGEAVYDPKVGRWRDPKTGNFTKDPTK